MKLKDLLLSIIQYSFYLLFFLTPLILTPYNYELFEFNKMLLVYGLTAIIAGTWVSIWIVDKKISIAKTPLDIPIMIFLASQVLSTVFSIDVHTSIWGYYSRFHGGLVSTICYIILYYAALTMTAGNKKFIQNSLYITLAAGFLITFYGVLEHFGIDAQYWVQDVKNRVFSTLGQPNWLGAWIDALIFIPIALIFPSKKNYKISLWLILFIFYFCLLFTGSRSAFFGFLAGLAVFLSLLVFIQEKSLGKKIVFILLIFGSVLTSFLAEWKPNNFSQIIMAGGAIGSLILLQFSLTKEFKKNINLLIIFLLAASVLAGTPINKALKLTGPANPPQQTTTLAYAPNISESSDIRKVVWQGTIDTWKHWPIFGSGVETFAYSYYNFRPREHNDLSEWDFLYNKAHNEYLNYLSTTGIVGLGSYLLLCGWFLAFAIKKNLQNKNLLVISLLAGYTSILVTNFFGFSVVPVAILFWLIPIFVFSFLNLENKVITITLGKQNKHPDISNSQYFFLLIIFLITTYLVYGVLRLWWADYKFAQGKKYSDSGYLLQGYQLLGQAVDLNKNEPLFHSQLGETAAGIALVYYQKEGTQAAQLVNQLTNQSLYELQTTLKQNNVHINYYKTIAKTYIYLGQINPQFYQNALDVLLKAGELAPTDAKIFFNLGLVYQELGNNQAAQSYLEKTVQLKPNYTVAHLTLAKFYYALGQKDKALSELKFVLDNIEPQQEEAIRLLKEWTN